MALVSNKKKVSEVVNCHSTHIAIIHIECHVRKENMSFDWTNADVDGSGRVKAWTNGGDNICPAGFGVPTKDELEKPSFLRPHWYKYP
jgi:hypothetical protein